MGCRKRLLALLAVGVTANSWAGMAEPYPEQMTLHGVYKKPGYEFCTETAVMKDGTTFKSNCIEFGGRVFGDVTTYSSNIFNTWRTIPPAITPPLVPGLVYLRNGADIRSARIHVKGRIADVWRYKIEFDLADYNQNPLSFTVNANYVKDAYLRYVGLNNLFFTAGQYKIATNSEELTSQSDMSFMERAQAVQAFVPHRRIGVQVNFFNSWLAAAAGIFGSDYRPAINDTPLAFGGLADEPLGFNARVFLTPLNQPGLVAGFGGSVWHQGAFDFDGLPDPNSRTLQTADNFRIYSNPGIKEYRDVTLVDTGVLASVNDVIIGQAEAALIYGPFDVEGAFFWNRLRRTGLLTNLDFNGWYVQASYFLTGEQRTWDAPNASFGPKTSNNNEYGAVQLAARYDVIDLNDINGLVTSASSYYGGRQENVTIGVNFYPTDLVRIMLNYIHATYNPGNGLPSRSYSMVGLRGQIVA